MAIRAMTLAERNDANAFWARVRESKEDRKVFKMDDPMSYTGRYAGPSRIRDQILRWEEQEAEDGSIADVPILDTHAEGLGYACGYVGQAHIERAERHGGMAVMTDWQWHAMVRAFEWRCVYCERTGSLTLDHVEPMSRGGDHALWNAVPACRSCNSGKRDRDLRDWRPNDFRAIEARVEAARARLASEIGSKWFHPGTSA